MKETIQWKCNTPQLLQEVMNNTGTSILKQPLTIFVQILGAVAKRAIELDDPILNELMVRLALYEGSTPGHPDYDDVWKAVDLSLKEYNKEKELKE